MRIARPERVCLGIENVGLGDRVVGFVSKLFSEVDSEDLDRCRVGEQ